jgi:hypothetical protein
MTELHIPASDTLSVLTDQRGNLFIQLTDEGERKLIEAVRKRTHRLETLTARRRAKLAAMPQDEFVALVLSRPGGLDRLEREEIVRRMHLIAEKVRPAFAAARAAGLIAAEAS